MFAIAFLMMFFIGFALLTRGVDLIKQKALMGVPIFISALAVVIVSGGMTIIYTLNAMTSSTPEQEKIEPAFTVQSCTPIDGVKGIWSVKTEKFPWEMPTLFSGIELKSGTKVQPVQHSFKSTAGPATIYFVVPVEERQGDGARAMTEFLDTLPNK